MSNADTPAVTGGNTATPIASQLGELPPRIRVHALAKLLGSNSRELMAKLGELGETVRSAQSSVTREVAHKLAEALAGGDEPETAEAAPAAEAPVAETPAAPEPKPEAEPEPAPQAEAPSRRVPPALAAPVTPEPPQATTRPAKASVHVPVFAAPSPVFLPPEPVAAKPARKPEPAFTPTEEAASDEDETQTEQAEGHGTDEDGDDANSRRRRRRGRRGRGRGKGGDEGSADSENEDEQPEESRAPRNRQQRAKDKDAETEEAAAESAEEASAEADSDNEGDSDGGSKRRRRRRRRKGGDDDNAEATSDDPPNTVVHVRQAKAAETERPARDEVRSVRGSTRLEAKRQRRRDGREAGRRRAPILSEAEFLARRESVERTMVVAEKGDSTQIGVLEDGVLCEHFVTSSGTGSIVGNVYLGRVQNVLPSMEAAFIDIGRGRNAVLYAGEVDWDAAGLEGKARKIEQALSTGDSVLVQVTKDPVGHKGARLTTQISLPGRFLVYVPAGGATGISRKLPENERRRLKDILKRIVPEDAGVIIRTASEGISEEELDRDVRRLKAQWDVIKEKAEAGNGGKKNSAPVMLYEEPDLLVKVVRDLFTEDFAKLEIQGDKAWDTIYNYVQHVAPDLADRVKRYTGTGSAFADHRIDEQITKALDRKVWLPSGGYLVIDRTEAMTVIDVNTGKFTGSGGNLEETVTRNNLESAEEIVRQLRLRDIGGIIVIDFIDMVLESNRELVLRRLTECLGRDRTRHQVAEVTSLGLVQMTRKKIGTGLLEAFSTPCEHCKGRGVVVSTEPQRTGGGGNGHNHGGGGGGGGKEQGSRRSRGRGKGEDQGQNEPAVAKTEAPPAPAQRESVVSAVQAVANATLAAKGEHSHEATENAENAEGGALNGHAPQAAEQPAEPVSEPVADATVEQAAEAAAEPVPEAVAEAPATELAGEPVTTSDDEAPAVREEEIAVVAESGPEPEAPEVPVTAETVVTEEVSAPEAPAAQDETEPEVDVPAPAVRSTTRRRPRRAASRPAGPPVKASEKS
ncbi:translation initiation factor IF-2 N-terminal domain-containing protein [Amycolatopsis roodepoortensis]|uniref:translation initiation factor IF-2 N-terminal domain-containing protein n=1 Tax=Amycolatopsis roodepoortensis TaxID=700274 RepID=UPI00214B6DB2|nr:translation initiation factor IF-2 N-terminal domain-containing protein [Amycolatopsis roodepoortensis]UUV34230.1 translation initiation factor IF-2 N-terminal domain-containing protein [Amycolatopsis roodepoortensis]